MKRFTCPECLTDFISERSPACPKCGGICMSDQTEIVQPGASQEAETEDNALDRVREILRSLCQGTYDVSYGSYQWDHLIEEALEEIMPLMQASK